MGLAGVAAALIGGVALHDGAVQLLDQGRDEGGLEEVVAAGLAGGDLYSHLALQAHAQGAVDLLQGLGGDLLSEINLCLFHGSSPSYFYRFVNDSVDGIIILPGVGSKSREGFGRGVSKNHAKGRQRANRIQHPLDVGRDSRLSGNQKGKTGKPTLKKEKPSKPFGFKGFPWCARRDLNPHVRIGH